MSRVLCKHCGKGYLQHEGKTCLNKKGTEFSAPSFAEVVASGLAEQIELGKQQLEMLKGIKSSLDALANYDDMDKLGSKVIKALGETNQLMEKSVKHLQKFEDERNGRR